MTKPAPASNRRVAAAYIRVSTDDQLEYSPDSQLSKIRSYADANNMVLPESFIFMDEGISGRTADKRPAFQALIGTAKCRPRPFDVVLLWKFSRFARSREDSIVYKSMLRKQLGIEVISVSENIGDDKLSVLIEAMIEAMDEYYSINLAEEVRRGMTQRAEQGKYNTYAPFGYRIERGQYVPDTAAAPVVRKIFADCLSGIPLLRIAREVSAMGVCTRFGNAFDSRQVEYILRNPVYIGKVRFTPTGRVPRGQHNPDTLTVDSRHEPLVDLSVYQAVQRRLDEQKRLYAPYSRTAGSAFLLKGLVKCSACGGTLTQAVRGESLQCHNYAKGRCTVSHSVRISLLTSAVLEQIERDFAGQEVTITVPDQTPSCSTPEDDLLSHQLAREWGKLRRIRTAYESGIDTLAEYQEGKARITAQIEQLEREMQHAERAALAQARKTVQDRSAYAEEQNIALRSFVRKIVFDRTHNSFSIQYYI